MASEDLYKQVVQHSADFSKEFITTKFLYNSSEYDLRSEKKKIDYILWCLNKSDSDLIFDRTLTALFDQTKQAQSNYAQLVQAAKEQPGSPPYQNIPSHVSNISSHLGQAVQIIHYPFIKQIFKSEAIEKIEKLENEAKIYLDSIRLDIESTKHTIRDEFEKFEREAIRKKNLIENQEIILQNLQQSIANLKAAVSQVADNKAREFDSLIDERREVLLKWQDDIEDSGKKYLNKIENYYNLTTNTTLAGRFVQAAREENFSYWINLVASIVFFLIAIGLVVWETRVPAGGILNVLSDPLFRWLGKLSLVAVCVIPAGIFASQATKHRRAATWYKTVGVRIATLKPYLSEFTGDYTNELREILKGFFMSDLNADGPRHERSTLGLKELEGMVGMSEKIRSFFAK